MKRAETELQMVPRRERDMLPMLVAHACTNCSGLPRRREKEGIVGVKDSRAASVLRLFVFGASLLSFASMTTSSVAAENGVLKLMVGRCQGAQWIGQGKGRRHHLSSGVGQVDSATGYTNSSGYVEIAFTSLEIGDEARTTVTPKARAGRGHTYVWVMGQGDEYGGVWDLGTTGDSLCSDGWYDPNNRIFECLYQ